MQALEYPLLVWQWVRYMV